MCGMFFCYFNAKSTTAVLGNTEVILFCRMVAYTTVRRLGVLYWNIVLIVSSYFYFSCKLISFASKSMQNLIFSKNLNQLRLGNWFQGRQRYKKLLQNFL
jgi:hypothetical protein